MSPIIELHQVPNRTWVEVQIKQRPGIKLPKIFFHHIDGMYSFCKTEDGETCHLVAWTPVRILTPDEHPKTK